MTEDFSDVIAARGAMREAYAQYHRCNNGELDAALEAALHRIRLTVEAMESALANHGLATSWGTVPSEEVWPPPKTGRVQ